MNTESRPYENFMSFRSSGVMLYSVPVNHRRNVLKSEAFNNNSALLSSRERYKGYVTTEMKRRMKKAITLLIQSTPYTWKEHPVTGKLVQHKLSFITLTTPDHDDSRDAKFCHKKLLEPMLRIMRRRFGMKSYIWKCELQGNGQIHYHITCDVFTNHSNLKNEWNALLRKNGLLEDFVKKYGHKNPNSTDIHSVNKVKNLEAYLVKYITKEYQNEDALSGKVWDCSKNLKKANYFRIHIDSAISDYISKLTNGFMSKIYCFDRATFVDFFTTDYYSNFSTTIIQQFSQFLSAVRDGIDLITSCVKSNTPNKKSLLTGGQYSTDSRSKQRQCQLALEMRI